MRTVLALAAVAVMASACAALHPPSSRAASTGRAVTSSPSAGPVTQASTVELSAQSANVVWALVDHLHLHRSTDAGDHWQQPPMPAQLGVRPVVTFLDDHEGWLLAPGSPTTQCGQEDAAVWHTTDAGSTWQQLAVHGPAPSQCTNGIWFFDSKHGFLSAWDQNHRPTVYRTADGGNSWAATTLQDPAYFQSAPGGFTLQVDWMKQFGSTLYLEAFGSQDRPGIPHDNQFVLKSTDGGASWTYVTKVPSREVVLVSEMRWLDFTAQGQAMESLNGGQQFHQYASDFATDSPDATQFVFAGANVGYASGSGLLQRTLDGGAHWTRLAAPRAPLPSSTPSVPPGPIAMPTDVALSAPSSNVVWALVAHHRCGYDLAAPCSPRSTGRIGRKGRWRDRV